MYVQNKYTDKKTSIVIKLPFTGETELSRYKMDLWGDRILNGHT